MLIAGFEFSDECPDECPMYGILFDQGNLCTRCPLFNCGDEDFKLIEPDDYRIWRTEVKGKYRRFMCWCSNCDRALVAGGKKCPVCGMRIRASKINQKSVVRKMLYKMRTEP